MVRLSEF
jgi:hypothetical protein